MDFNWFAHGVFFGSQPSAFIVFTRMNNNQEKWKWKILDQKEGEKNENK